MENFRMSTKFNFLETVLGIISIFFKLLKDSIIDYIILLKIYHIIR